MKVNVIAGIEAGNPNLPPGVEGSLQRPRRWIKITYENCDQFIFGQFCEEVCHDLEANPAPGGVDNERILMWDGLGVHNTPFVTHIIDGRPSNNVFHHVTRPPYRPKIAPIEYFFCELACELDRRVRRDWTHMDLRTNIEDICSTLGFDGKMNKTFAHCGYPFL
jgi:hypothetical protein